jgi:hypothetical protein
MAPVSTSALHLAQALREVGDCADVLVLARRPDHLVLVEAEAEHADLNLLAKIVELELRGLAMTLTRRRRRALPALRS